MPNIFTALQPVLYSAAQEVSAEPFGVISAIASSFDDKGVAVGDSVTVPVAPTRALTDFTPAMTATAGTDATAVGIPVTITFSKKADWNLTGEQIRSLENGGNDTEWVRQMLMQGMRSLRNFAETQAALAIQRGASRAVGTAGTTPFASNLDLLVDTRTALRNNGAPMADLQFVMNTAAAGNLQKLGIYQQANLAGSDNERRTGTLAQQFGFTLRDSAGIALHTKGTGTSYVTSGVTAAGVRDVALITGTGTVLAGDVVTFAADAVNKFVINTGVAAAGTITLGRPGAITSIATANAMTVGNNYTPNVAFERNAVVGILRPPIFTPNPTITQTQISDDMGMTYLLVQIAGYGMTTWELHLAGGFKVVNSEHVMVLMG